MSQDNADHAMHDDDDDEYDEEADSDFDDRASRANSESSSDADTAAGTYTQKSTKPRVEELDSGDEITIKERKKSKEKKSKKQQQKDGAHVSTDDERGEEWRAKTRSMRAQDQMEKRKRAIPDLKASTVDVNKIWEEMNRPGPLPALRVECEEDQIKPADGTDTATETMASTPSLSAEKMITIRRQFKFAGEVHTEEKMVPESSAEAKLWKAQQDNDKATDDGITVNTQRPLRKISRFDPNYSNMDAFRNVLIKAQPSSFKGPKLNVVEKSKMDWASHVDAEGLKDELNEHSRAKGAYLNRMDFLGQVEQRKEEEARLARKKG